MATQHAAYNSAYLYHASIFNSLMRAPRSLAQREYASNLSTHSVVHPHAYAFADSLPSSRLLLEIGGNRYLSYPLHAAVYPADHQIVA